MKRTHPRKRPQNVALALGAVLVTAGCATTPAQNAAAPAERSSRHDGGVEQLLAYCGKLRDTGELATAAGICDRAHSLAPADPRPIMMLGEIFTRMEQLPQAEGAYLTVLEQTPHNVEARYLLGKVYIATGRHDLALQALNFALTQSPEDARIYNALGIANGMLGDQAAARQAFENGLKVAPNDVPLRNNLGLALVLGGQHDEGIAVLQAVAADPAATATTIRNLRLAEGIAQAASNGQAVAGAANPGGAQIASTATIPAEFGSEPEPVFSEPSEEAPATAAIPSPQPSRAAPASVPREPVMLTEALSPLANGIQLADSGAPVYLVSEPGAEEPEESVAAIEPDGDTEIEPDGDTETESTATASVEDDAEEPDADDDSAAAQAEKSDLGEMVAAEDQSGSAGASSQELNPMTMPPLVLVPKHELPAGEETAATAELQSFVTADVNPAAPPMAVPGGTQSAALGGENVFSVQLGSFRSADRAQDGWRQIRASALDLLQDVDPVIRRSDQGPEKGIYFRLRTKPASKEAANRLCSALQARGLSCLTFKEDPVAIEETATPAAAKS